MKSEDNSLYECLKAILDCQTRIQDTIENNRSRIGSIIDSDRDTLEVTIGNIDRSNDNLSKLLEQVRKAETHLHAYVYGRLGAELGYSIRMRVDDDNSNQ